MAYSRRAALLAEDLNDWATTYRTDLTWGERVAGPVMDIAVRHERVLQLDELVTTLQRVAIQLQALR